VSQGLGIERRAACAYSSRQTLSIPEHASQTLFALTLAMRGFEHQEITAKGWHQNAPIGRDRWSQAIS
jgi:hypothetical protein